MPLKTFMSYSVLAGAAIIHWAEGAALLYDTYALKEGEAHRWEKKRAAKRRVLVGVGLACIVGGLVRLWKDPIEMPLPTLLARYDAVLDKSVLY